MQPPVSLLQAYLPDLPRERKMTLAHFIDEYPRYSDISVSRVILSHLFVFQGI